MSKLDRQPRYQNNTPQTWHDMSYDFKFTAANGHLNPVLTDLLLPGDKVDLQSTYAVRVAQPLLAAAMVDIDFHVESFFVPMTMLWSPFEDWIYNVNNYYSAAYVSGTALTLPLALMNQVKESIAVNGGNNIDRNVSYESYAQRYLRLASLLGYNPYISPHSGSDSDSFTSGGQGEIHGYQPNVFPYAALAYQAVWQNFYRLDERTKFENTSFNVDNRSAFYHTSPFIIQYRPYYMDYFTSAKLSPLINEKNLRGNLSVSNLLQSYQDLSTNFVNVLFKKDNNGPIAADNLLSDALGSFESPVSLGNNRVVTKFETTGIDEPAATDPGGGSYQSTNQLRTLFANEKLLMVTARARKNYDAQTLAHFGVKVPHDVKHEISFLGSDSFRLAINELVSTADTKQTSGGTTTGASLGEYFGKGSAGKQTKTVRFTAPCHGVLLQIFSVLPRYDYIVPFLKKHFIQNRLDFFQPEYDNLGMSPLFRYEIIGPYKMNVAPADSLMASRNTYKPDWMYDVQGWQYRYEQYKRNFNRATIAFERGSVYSAWALTRTPYAPLLSRWSDLGFSGEGYYYNGSEISWRDYYTDNSFMFYAQPSDLDQLFAVSYPLTWDSNWNKNNSLAFYYDPFVVNSRFNYKKKSIMSTYSMPKFD